MLDLSSRPSLPLPGCELVQKQSLSYEVINRKELVNKCKVSSIQQTQNIHQKKKNQLGEWWHMPIVLELGIKRQED